MIATESLHRDILTATIRAIDNIIEGLMLYAQATHRIESAYSINGDRETITAETLKRLEPVEMEIFRGRDDKQAVDRAIHEWTMVRKFLEEQS